MPKIESRLRGAFKRFISNGYRTGILDERRMIATQIHLGETIGEDLEREQHPGPTDDDVTERINRYRTWAAGASGAVLKTVSVMAECLLDDSASYPWGKIQMAIENALSRFEQKSLRKRESLGLEHLLFDDSDYLLSVMKPWAIFSDGEKSDELIARFIDDTVNDWRENYNHESGLRLLQLIRELDDDDEDAAMTIVSLSIEASAMWHMQRWRYRNGERTDDISDAARNVYIRRYYMERGKAETTGYEPTTVTAAMQALIDAYGLGKSAFN